MVDYHPDRKGKQSDSELIPVYRAGMKFIDCMTEKTNALAELIDKDIWKKIERRLCGARHRIVNSSGFKIYFPGRISVINISLNGVLIETEIPLNIGSVYHLFLLLDNQMLDTEGKVLHLFKTDSPYIYRAGIEFSYISDNNRNILDNYLTTLQS